MKDITKSSNKNLHNNNEDILQGLRVSRLLSLRYVSAIYFFTTLFWVISFNYKLSVFALPAALLLIAATLSVVEIITLKGEGKVKLNKTKLFFKINLVTCIFTGICTIIFGISRVYPFLISNTSSYYFLTITQVINLILTGLFYKKAILIETERDKKSEMIRKFISQYT